MENQVFTFNATEHLSLENSYAVLKDEVVNLSVSVGINDNTRDGFFEIYDIESGGNDWYAEGCLSFEGKKVTGYDGVFALPTCVVDKLKEIGYDVSEVE